MGTVMNKDMGLHPPPAGHHLFLQDHLLPLDFPLGAAIVVA